ncbi:hypothetical protein BLA29_000527 [Euroglyphus maynei]|uniref:Uncharacterized protein n=1 Tax=Euroglyphus maynei TaxID=6958 RepID=A0A1Y3BHI7_EURMA|nr:hypothetical protein BLA29_000527 [Euroglyphus maynei]
MERLQTLDDDKDEDEVEVGDDGDTLPVVTVFINLSKIIRRRRMYLSVLNWFGLDLRWRENKLVYNSIKDLSI